MSLILGIWIFSGWPQIWQNPPIPPKIQVAYAANYGKDTIGGTSSGVSADNKRFTKFTSPADISEADSICAYLNRTATGGGYAIRGGIYTDSSGVPGSLVTNSDIEINSNISRNSPNWYCISYTTKPSLSASTVYWIGVQAAKASLTYYDAGTTNQTYTKTDTYSDGLDASWGVAGTGANQEHSFYVSYTPPVPSVSVSDGTVEYGVLAANATMDTVTLGGTNPQTVTNDTGPTETINIKGKNATAGGCSDWTLVLTDPPGSEQYWHKFSTDGGTVWNYASTDYLVFETGVAPSATRDLNLMIRMPSDTACSATMDMSMTLQAVAE